ncbi:MAG: hypothetical protein HC793_01050, partial [Aquincola sp.]|nr:hypothetical protein [Aquincola sp.]
LIAGVTGLQTRFPSLELSNQGHRLAVSADGIQLPAEKNPEVVFQQFFLDPAGGVAGTAAAGTPGTVADAAGNGIAS